MLTDTRIAEALAEVKKRVKITCDDEHVCTAVKGCLDGNDPKDVLICQLIETIQTERQIISDAFAKILKRT